jgi:methionyl-tRNA synthetase
MDKKAYCTTTLPYVNAAPHIGFALELVQADVIARHFRLQGKEVFFNTGTDEHGAKIWKSAEDAGKSVQEFVDENAEHFKKLVKALDVDLGEGRFIRTTDPDHVAAAQEFWKRCDAAGDIYKAKYGIKYCTGCELEKTESELENGKCPIHPNLVIEEREEQNYFFRFSKYQKDLLDLYDRYPDFVVPAHRLTEIRNFVSEGLKDFSVSRLKEKMPWGVPVPGDETHVMYVWFDALVNYVSTLGWPNNEKKFTEYWGTTKEPKAIQFAGKDNLRQQSAMWQAMLLSAGLPPSRQIVIHGFITSGGEKMSKSRGNVIDPFEVVEKYGTDALRYWLLREMPTFEDGDFTWERFKLFYNAHLANGIGNLASRVLTMAKSYGAVVGSEKEVEDKYPSYFTSVRESLGKYAIQDATSTIEYVVTAADVLVQKLEPFKVFKSDPEKARKDTTQILEHLYVVGLLLRPFLPMTSEKILDAIKNNKELSPLFPRIA